MTGSGFNRRELLKAGAAGSGMLLSGGAASALAGQSRGLDYRFPRNFVWGAGTAGLQHEGSPLADGAGPSAFYTWSHTPGNVIDGQSIDVCADFYNRYRGDVRLMHSLGLKAAHFEPSWSRVLPQGTGTVNQAGLDFYDRLVDEMLGAGIDPVCGLYIWDHPEVLHDPAGWSATWEKRDFADWFAEYAALMFDTLGDRVVHWLTLCEPGFPFDATELTPGLKAMHHLQLAHGRAVQAFRASDATGEIGNWHLLAPALPATDSPEDVAAAERMQLFSNALILDPQFLGAYPEEIVEWYGDVWPHDAIHDGDMEIIATPIDFIGVDYYLYYSVVHDPDDTFGLGLQLNAEFFEDAPPLKDGLVWLRDRYSDPTVYIVEIGKSLADEVVRGKVHDPVRLEHLRNCLVEVHGAMRAGVDVRGAFVWSLLDGWEFFEGLTARYGLIHVDFETQRRTIKSSGYWYRDLIRANGFDVPGGEPRRKPRRRSAHTGGGAKHPRGGRHMLMPDINMR